MGNSATNIYKKTSNYIRGSSTSPTKSEESASGVVVVRERRRLVLTLFLNLCCSVLISMDWYDPDQKLDGHTFAQIFYVLRRSL